MAHGNNIEQQWAAEPLKLRADNPCGAMQASWPYKTCNLTIGHDGPHCHAHQAGEHVSRIWWNQ